MPEPITIRTMAPPGATQDLLLQHLKTVLAQRGSELRVENSPGKDGLVAAGLALADAPDGRHFLLTSGYALTYYPFQDGAAYKAEALTPLAAIGRYNFVLIASPATAGDLRELIARARDEKRALRYAGTGEIDRMLVAAMARRGGVDIAFKAANGPALLETVLTGEVDVAMGTGTHQPLLRDGKVRVVAQLHPRAERGGPPTPADLGVDVALDNFMLLSCRADADATARAVSLATLRAALADASVTALIRDRMLMLPAVLTGADLAAALAAQKAACAKLKALAA